MYALGRKEYGRLGLGEDAEETREPTLVSSLNSSKCIQVNAGTAVSFAVTEAGQYTSTVYSPLTHLDTLVFKSPV